jgi:hypothetical protein
MARIGDASISALTAYGRYWFLALVAAIIAAIAANLFIRLPLGQVVDVVLALVLVGMAVAEVYFLLRAVAYIVSGRISAGLLWLGAMVIYLLLVFPPILAFDGYAYVTGQEIAGASRVYDGVNSAISALFKFPAQLISALIVVVFHAGSTYVNYVAKAKGWLEVAANALSIIVALQTLLAARRRRGPESED